MREPPPGRSGYLLACCKPQFTMPKLGMTHSVGDPGKYIVLTETNNLRERERERERE